MASNKHRRRIRYWPLHEQSPRFRGLYNLKPVRESEATDTIGGVPRLACVEKLIDKWGEAMDRILFRDHPPR